LLDFRDLLLSEERRERMEWKERSKEKGKRKEGKGKGKGGEEKGRERVPLALILQFDHCLCDVHHGSVLGLPYY